MIRKVVSLTTAFSFLFLIISSVMLYIVPEGRVAYWADWSIIFTKSQWGDLHITGGTLFVVFGIWHTVLNFKAIANYCKAAFDAQRRNPRPLLVSLLICLFVYAGTLLNVPPMRQLVSWNDAIKDYQAAKHGEPPFGHAETSSLRQFGAFLGLDVEGMIAAMKKADFKGNLQPDSVFQDIATANDMTPQQLYDFILKSSGGAARPAASSATPGSGMGQGKRLSGDK